MSPHASWLLVSEIVPRLAATIPQSVSRVGCEDWQELIQDGTAIAAQILASAEKRGKLPTAGNIAYYATRLLQSGRRSTGSSNTDVLGSGTQRSQRSSACSLDEEFDANLDGTVSTLGELLSGSADDPATAALCKLDWESFLRTLDADAKRLVEWIASGGTLAELARKRKRSPVFFTRKKQQIAGFLAVFFKEEIAAAFNRDPQWRIDLRARRERSASRYVRSLDSEASDRRSR